jgi:hypothetical protein
MSDAGKSPFPAGFERDAKTLLLAYDMKAMPLHVLIHNLQRLGVEWPEAPAPRPAPALERPSLAQPTFEPEFEVFADNENLAYEVHTGAVYNVHSGEHVGFIDLEEEPEEVIEMMIPEEELEEPAEIGPPPEGAEFEEPELDEDGVALPRPNPEDDEQVATELPE